jgi:hypothetical protein
MSTHRTIVITFSSLDGAMQDTAPHPTRCDLSMGYEMRFDMATLSFVRRAEAHRPAVGWATTPRNHRKRRTTLAAQTQLQLRCR